MRKVACTVLMQNCIAVLVIFKMVISCQPYHLASFRIFGSVAQLTAYTKLCKTNNAKCCVLVLISVADQGCLSRMPDPNFFDPRPEFFYPGFLSSRKYDPSRSSRIRILIFYPSRIQGSKRHRIPNPQHWYLCRH